MVISYQDLKVQSSTKISESIKLTAEENLKMLEIRDTQGNVNILIFKPTLLYIVPNAQSSHDSCGKGKIF